MDQDISSSCNVQFQTLRGDPYLEVAPSEAVASFMKGLMPLGKISGGDWELGVDPDQIMIPAG